jgi:hypothetical protein
MKRNEKKQKEMKRNEKKRKEKKRGVDCVTTQDLSSRVEPCVGIMIPKL